MANNYSLQGINVPPEEFLRPFFELKEKAPLPGKHKPLLRSIVLMYGLGSGGGGGIFRFVSDIWENGFKLLLAVSGLRAELQNFH